jgi:CRP-like cAMP-binding protein
MPSPKAFLPLNFPAGNRILAALPPEEYSRMLPDLTPVHLPQDRLLWNAGDRISHAFFLMGGMVSLLSTTEGGSTVEVGMIGSEGMAGVSAILRFNVIPYTVVVQLPASAMRIRIDTLRREFARGGRLQDLLLRYTHTLLTQITQSACCNRFHTAEERLCRWLLTSSDRSRSDTLPLTQEFLAQMIGVPRTSVTAVAVKLQHLGLIAYRRGKIKLLDRRGLETFSCECHRVIGEGIRRYLAA